MRARARLSHPFHDVTEIKGAVINPHLSRCSETLVPALKRISSRENAVARNYVTVIPTTSTFTPGCLIVSAYL